MRMLMIHTIAAAISIGIAMSGPAAAQTATYPPLRDYLLPRTAEIALAESAAPENITTHATIKVLTEKGYEVVRTGQNGFVCAVMRGWTAPTYTPKQFRDLTYDPTVRAPICFDPIAARTVLPYYELRSSLGMAGKSPDAITEAVAAAYANGQLPKREGVSFAYMWSAEQQLGSGVGHWHPHVMVFSPYYDNAMMGGNAFGSPLPQVTDDAGTPFAVVVIPVDHQLAGKSKGGTR
jgi:hypothetical protein